MQRVHAMKNWTLILLLICLVGGAAAISFWVHRNYAPLRGVVRALQVEKPARTGQTANEYEFIKETIRMTMREERELRHMLSRQTPVIQAGFLARFVRGHVDAARMTDESLRFMDIRLVSACFAVMLIDIADFSRFSADQSEKQWALMRFIIANIGTDLIREREWGYSVELDQHHVALLVNFAKERQAEAAANELDAIAGRLKQIVEERFKTYMTIAIGNVHEGKDRVGESYLEALGALDYKIYRGRGSIIRYREIADADCHYYYPIETEIQLINFTKAGDVDNADKLIANLFHTHFSQRRMTPELGRSLLGNMVSTMWKIIHPLDPSYREVFGEGFDPLKELSACPTIEEMKVNIRAWFLALCQYLKSSRSRYSRQLAERVAHYIEDHYGDDMLSLTTIAEHFGLTPPYLSSFFKKQMGMNLTDYLTRVRMEEAKKLMHDKKLTFTQIAHKVGYASDIGFIRVFKKYEGTTPGKYRESM
jgi:AraC-like DNA-binding protein